MGRLAGFRYRQIIKRLKAFGFEPAGDGVQHDPDLTPITRFLLLYPVPKPPPGGLKHRKNKHRPRLFLRFSEVRSLSSFIAASMPSI